MPKKILVAMSGGVDSSVAAVLLKEKGFEVGGATIRIWPEGHCEEKNENSCCGLRGVRDAQSVALKLDIPHHVFNFSAPFQTGVIDYFANEYKSGKTPNPCIACNQYIKFTLLLERARLLGYDSIATGHYARVCFDQRSGRYYISESKDFSKDQSYVLFGLPQDVLANLSLPLGDYTKKEVREIAKKTKLKVADKPDSQDICFIPDHDYGKFLERERGMKPITGPIVDLKGKKLGEHEGYYHYTIGQRKGLRVPFQFALYVVAIDPETNTVVVGPKAAVKKKECLVGNVQWFLPPDSKIQKPIEAKIRARHNKAPAKIEIVSNDEVKVVFDEPQDAITPGQACVFYDGTQVLGGGWIEKFPWPHPFAAGSAGYQKLKQIISGYQSVVVAFSGGVDSALLLRVAYDVLGRDSVLAVTAASESIASRELEEAKRIGKEIGVNHRIVSTMEIKNPNYISNSNRRCYHCKGELYKQLKDLLKETGFREIICGTNMDDLSDFRPGHDAASEYGVKNPLVEAGLHKHDVRALSRELGLPVWDKPASPCLASRIPYGSEIKPEKLRQIENGENFLKDLSFREVRLRHFGQNAKIELGEEELNRLKDHELREKIIQFIRSLGFETVVFEPFRSGNLNDKRTENNQ